MEPRTAEGPSQGAGCQGGATRRIFSGPGPGRAGEIWTRWGRRAPGWDWGPRDPARIPAGPGTHRGRWHQIRHSGAHPHMAFERGDAEPSQLGGKERGRDRSWCGALPGLCPTLETLSFQWDLPCCPPPPHPLPPLHTPNPHPVVHGRPFLPPHLRESRASKG